MPKKLKEEIRNLCCISGDKKVLKIDLNLHILDYRIMLHMEFVDSKDGLGLMRQNSEPSIKIVKT